MSLIFDLYVPRRSWLHRVDPRVKLWVTLLGIVGAFLLLSPLYQAALLACSVLVLRTAGVPWRSLRWLWRQMRLLVLLIVVLQPFFTPSGAVWFAWGPLTLTAGGVNWAALLALRALNMAFITGGLLFTTEHPALVRAFTRLGLPYTWGLTLSLTLRFLPAIGNLFTAVQDAQAARGWVAEGNLLRRMRDYLPVLIAVIIGTLRLSDQVTLALAARGLGEQPTRTVWRDLAMRRIDWLLFVVITVGFVVLLLWRFA